MFSSLNKRVSFSLFSDLSLLFLFCQFLLSNAVRELCERLGLRLVVDKLVHIVNSALHVVEDLGGDVMELLDVLVNEKRVDDGKDVDEREARGEDKDPFHVLRECIAIHEEHVAGRGERRVVHEGSHRHYFPKRWVFQKKPYNGGGGGGLCHMYG